METATGPADVLVEDNVSLVLLRPQSVAGREWLAENCPGATYYGPAVVCETRYVAAIVAGLRHDGLKVERGG